MSKFIRTANNGYINAEHIVGLEHTTLPRAAGPAIHGYVATMIDGEQYPIHGPGLDWADGPLVPACRGEYAIAVVVVWDGTTPWAVEFEERPIIAWRDSGISGVTPITPGCAPLDGGYCVVFPREDGTSMEVNEEGELINDLDAWRQEQRDRVLASPPPLPAKS